MEFEVTIFTMISHSGEARSSSMEAIAYAKKGDFIQAAACLEDANRKLDLAHGEQTKLIQSEAQGKKVEISLLLVHAQDHLMNAIVLRDLATEFVDLYKHMNK
jgi:PTS system cellobiose-specific IIA component